LRVLALIGDWIKKLPSYFAWSGVAALLFMLVWSTADVIGNFIGNPIEGTIEWIEVVMVFVIMFPLIYTQSVKRHVMTDVISRRFKGRTGQGIYIFGLLIQLLFMGIVAYGASVTAARSIAIWENMYVTTNVYFWPGKLAAAIGTIGASIVLLVHIATAFRRRVVEKYTYEPLE